MYLNPGLQLSHSIDRLAFHSHRQMRIGEAARVEQIGREGGVAALHRLSVYVGIAEQALFRTLYLPGVQSR